MGLFSKFKFGQQSSPGTLPAPGATAEASEIARDARARARRRLIGASLLLGAGIIGFPLLFESRPRPIPVDIPIEIPAREGVTPLTPPVARAGAQRATPLSAQPADDVVTSETPGDKEAAAAAKPPSAPAAAKLPAAKQEAPQAEPRTGPARSEPPKVEAKPEPAAVAKPAAPKPVPAKAAQPPAKVPSTPPASGPAAKAADHPADEGRYVVQIGAFAEVTTAHDARMKVEGLGLKTYTQVIESATGRRIRVRVGPYPSKAEADKAAARIKAGGLQAAVLVL